MANQPRLRGDVETLGQPAFEAIIDAHERFLRGRGGIRAVLKFARAARLDGRRRLLNDADLTGADLEGARLTGAHFERASLQCANLRGADLRAANLKRADLRGASLAGASLNGAVLDEADMRAARILRAGAGEILHPVPGRPGGGIRGAFDGAAADFSNCAMRGVRLCSANLKGVNFNGAVLEGANFTDANVAGASFEGAVITGAIGATRTLTAEQLGACVAEPVTADSRRPALAAMIEVAGLWFETGGAAGAPAMLDGEDLRFMGNLLRGRALTALAARGVIGIGVDFSESQLQGANFRGADLRGAVFEAADLRGACFDDARLSHARFGRALLTPLSLVDGRVLTPTFQGASLERADFSLTALEPDAP